ncbi:MAG: lipopolysaccharide biosynthesis protein [Gemmatimonadaceae bacterium]
MERKERDVTLEHTPDTSTDVSETNSSPQASQDGAASVRSQRAALDRSLTHGIAWMGGVKWITQMLTWGSTILVARVLDPSDFGLYAFATSYMGIVTLLSEFGIGTTVVTFRKLSDDGLSQINTLAVLFGAVGFLVSCIAAPLLALFYRAPALTAVVIASSTVFLITGVRVVPQAILQRDLRFRELAVNEGLQAILTSIGAVVFALMGFRYWTLVLSSVLGALLSTLLMLRVVRMSFTWPQWQQLKAEILFSQQTIASRISWYLYQNADFFVAGRMLGQQALGAYDFGWTLASAPIERVTSLAGRVTPSILSAVQHDSAELRRYLLSVTEALALVAFPLTVGLALVAQHLVPLALGAKWEAAIVPLQILAVAAAVRSIAPLYPQVLMVTGANQKAMQVNLLALVVMPIAFVIGARWGTPGIAFAWLIVYPVLVVVPMANTTFRRIGMGWREYVATLIPATNATTIMAVAVLGVGALLPTSTHAATFLTLKVATGVVAYGGALWVFHRTRVMTFVRVIRRSRSSGAD